MFMLSAAGLYDGFGNITCLAQIFKIWKYRRAVENISLIRVLTGTQRRRALNFLVGGFGFLFW